MTRLSKSYFDKKLRVGKLDSALLFLSSTVGIIFAVIRAAISPSASIVTAIPLIILGIVLPFYYGYVRGALVRSSTVDRYRGWIFFLVGLGAYGYSIIVEWMNVVLPAYVGRGAYWFDIPLAIGAVLPAYLIARKFHKFIFKVLGEPPSKIISSSAFLTAMSAILFAFVGSDIATLQSPNPWVALGLFLFIAVGAFYLRQSGRFAGYANSDVPYSVQVITGRWHDRRLVSWIVNALYYGGILLFVGATLYFLTAASTAADVIGYLVELIVALLLIVTHILLWPRIGRREVYRDRLPKGSEAEFDSTHGVALSSRNHFRSAIVLNRIRLAFWALALVSTFVIGVATEFVVLYRPSVDPLWTSVIVAAVLALATLLLMRENRLFRLEAVKPAFGFEFGTWPIDGIPVRWYLKNSGALVRMLRIEIKQGLDVKGLSLPSCGRDELVKLGDDFQSRYDQGGKVSLEVVYGDIYHRSGKELVEIDFDELKRSGGMPYSHTHLAALEEIVQELRRLRP